MPIKPKYQITRVDSVKGWFDFRPIRTYRGIGKSVRWDPYAPTARSLSCLPRDLFWILRKVLVLCTQKHGKTIEARLSALHEAGILCGFVPRILKNTRTVIWRAVCNGELVTMARFQVVNWRWRKSGRKVKKLEIRDTLKSKAFLRFVVDSDHGYVWPQKVRTIL